MQQSDDVHLRDARPDDRDAISTLTLAAYGEYASVMPPQIWEIYQQEIVKTLADVSTATQIVAERAGTIIGSVLVYPPASDAYSGYAGPPSWPEVRLLAVHPASRRHGIGQILMQECVRRAQQSGATILGLHTMDMMQSAMRLYIRMGFQRTPEYDFRPAEGVLIKGFILPLTQP